MRLYDIRHPCYHRWSRINDAERVILPLPTRLCGLGLKFFAETAKNEYKDSTRITTNEGKTTFKIKAEREKRNQEKLRQFLAASDGKTKRMMETLNQKGIPNWLTNLPIKELGYELTKREFQDAIKIKHNWPLDISPSKCIYGASFDITHALSCKKGGFITLRKNEVRDTTSELLDKVCVDVRKEPILQEVNNKDLPWEANKSKKARLDISALNLWTFGQRVFFDVKVFNLFAQRQ